MRKIRLIHILVWMLFNFPTLSFGDTANHKSDIDTVKYSKPKIETSNGVPYYRKMSQREYDLSLYVLIFSGIVLIFQLIIILKKDIGPSNIIKFMIVTLIISGTLFIITAGFGGSELSPALGLLGTIAGYLLGKTDQPNNPKSEV